MFSPYHFSILDDQNCLLYITGILSTDGARKVDVKKRFADGLGRHVPRSRRDGTDAAVDVEQILNLEAGEHLQQSTSITTATGSSKEKLVETYKGLRVPGQSVVVETEDGDLTGEISGHLVEGISEDIPDVRPLLNENQALAAALHYLDNEDIHIVDSTLQVELEVYISEHESSQDVIAVLTYFMSYMMVDDDGELSRPTFIIDANSGDVILYYDGLTTRKRDMRKRSTFPLSAVGGNVKVGKNLYGDILPALNVYMENGLCFLESEKVTVIDATPLYSDEQLDINNSFSFSCEQSFNDSVNGAYSPLADAFFFGIMTYDVFQEWLGVEPLIFKIVLAIHYNAGYDRFDNAFWNGVATFYGDGGDSTYPYVTLDTVAHEVAHGFTEQNSGLIYRDQSGGMNEAFSDISGATAEAYMKEADWLDGQGLMKHEDAMRYFEDPSLDGHSVGSMDEYCPGINIHHSSGLYNRAFYLLSNTPGWNLRKSFQSFAVANQMYWTRDSTFNTGACGVIQAAEDLGFEADDVRNAFEAVGINPCGHAKDGIDALHNIQMVANETVQYMFNFEHEHSTFLSFEVRAIRPTENTYLRASLDTPTAPLSVEGNSPTIEVDNPEVGQYLLTVETFQHPENIDIFAIINSVILVDELGLEQTPYGYLYTNGSFQLPEAIVTAGQPVLIRLMSPDSIKAVLVVSSDNKVNTESSDGGYDTYSRYTTETMVAASHICKLENSTYNYEIGAIGMDLTLVAGSLLLPDLDWTY